MQLALGILLLVSFLVFIVYAAKGGNLMMGLFVMAVLWCAIGAIGGVVTWEDINTTVFNQGPLDFGSTAVNIIFGSWVRPHPGRNGHCWHHHPQGCRAGRR